MKGAARLNDLTSGVCYHPSHMVPFPTKGRIITASSNVFVNSRGAARLDDLVMTDCGHTDQIMTASGDSWNIKPFARLDDKVGKSGIYIATIVTASSNSDVN